MGAALCADTAPVTCLEHLPPDVLWAHVLARLAPSQWRVVACTCRWLRDLCYLRAGQDHCADARRTRLRLIVALMSDFETNVPKIAPPSPAMVRWMLERAVPNYYERTVRACERTGNPHVADQAITLLHLFRMMLLSHLCQCPSRSWKMTEACLDAVHTAFRPCERLCDELLHRYELRVRTRCGVCRDVADQTYDPSACSRCAELRGRERHRHRAVWLTCLATHERALRECNEHLTRRYGDRWCTDACNLLMRVQRKRLRCASR
ncbi:hypothetical protein CYMTET_40911 [Cymbomonas tetramitiformis]|uniref:F-box domain-containing protein n=1 Tax=Cymbomonas tetramitiformis TaxID=36881 RepID=A0AAE0C733_9CHLO|nr:hypothetical protein CYMTET_40911 [Cymbomonas tetramitiformis]|eukprot:gene211-383_t